MHFSSPLRILLLLASSLVLSASMNAGTLQVASVFGDHMVLQADRPIAVWGTAKPGATIEVDVGGEKESALADEAGRWRTVLQPRKASFEALKMSVQSEGEHLTMDDVLIGEVWLCGGQSNMVRPLSMTTDGDKAAATADLPALRVFKTGFQMSREPRDSVEGKWAVCAPRSAPEFSAVAFYFARDLAGTLKVPVGLIVSAVGGTPAEAWTPREALAAAGENLKYTHARLLATEQATVEKSGPRSQELEAWKAARAAVEDPAPGLIKGWQSPGASPDGWTTVDLPDSWERVKPESVDGSVWFRRTFTAKAGDIGACLALGVTRNRPRAWLNGRELAGAKEFEGGSRTVFTLEEKDIRPGENTLAVRLIIAGGKGGIQASDRPLGIYSGRPEGAPLIPLEGKWLCRIEQPLPVENTPDKAAWEDKTTPGILWNGMVAPLIPIGLRGVIWYQGEANVPRAAEYRDLFPVLVSSWRAAWGEPKLPFLFVQLAGFQKPSAEPSESTWAPLRAAQEAGLQLEQTAMVVAYDEGDPLDIHPRNKKPVGDRLALAAKNKVYGLLSAAQALSPRLQKITHEADGSLRLAFDPEVNLQVSGTSEVRGVALAGADRKFVWATARIEGPCVIVNVPAGLKPAWIRYAWANFPQANLVSAALLPVAPFESAVPAPVQ